MLVMIDLDNTLADRAGAVRSWLGEFCLEHALPPDAADWILAADNDGYADRREVFAAVRDRYLPHSSVEVLMAAYQRRVIEVLMPRPGATDCLLGLRARGWKTAIVSNGSTGQQHAKIDALGLRSLVDTVCISGDLGVAKPDRRIFERAATMTGAPLAGAWMVGDAPHHDIVGAAGLGLETAWLHRGRAWPHSSVSPTITIDSLDELIVAIESVESAT